MTNAARPTNLSNANVSSNESTEKNYLIRILSSAPVYVDRVTSLENNSKADQGVTMQNAKKNSTANKSINGVDRLVNQIKQVLPDLGHGYIEAALACYGHDVERTIAALLEGNLDQKSLHHRLQILDKKLPASKKQNESRYGGLTRNTTDGGILDKEDEEAKRIQKARFREMEKEAESQAFLLSSALQGEYDDDYDDQYDGLDDGGGIGGADGGIYDVDLDAIRVYNRVAKEIESDRQYWGDNRNLNRQQKVKTESKEKTGDEEVEDVTNGEKKYRGPNKGKKGRIIGPDGKYIPYPKHRKAIGHRSSDKKIESNVDSNNSDGSKMTKIQKRRKNDNKAKIGNHHRKERALKKAG